MLVALSLLTLVSTSGAIAQYRVTLTSITPAVTDISSQFTDRSPRSVFFFLRGEIGTTYNAVFSVTDQPSVTVGVGIDISALSYDPGAKTISMTFTFVRPFVAKPGSRPFPRNSFLITFDPGKAQPFGSSASGSAAAGQGAEVDCYGPGNTKDRATQGSSTAAAEQGPPREARGTYMSTDILSWCVAPPKPGVGTFGFKLSGPKGTEGFFKMYVPPPLVQLLAQQQGRGSFTPDDLAIFNGSSEASVDVTPAGGGGVLINIKTTFDSNSTIVTPRSGSLQRNRVSVPHTAQASTEQVTKFLKLGEREPLSLAPNKFKLTGSSVTLYGFVTDKDQLAGQTVKLFDVTSSKLVRTKATTLKLVASSTISSSGSYSVTVKKTKISSLKKKKKSTLQAKVTSSSVRSSRTITVTSS